MAKSTAPGGKRPSFADYTDIELGEEFEIPESFDIRYAFLAVARAFLSTQQPEEFTDEDKQDAMLALFEQITELGQDLESDIEEELEEEEDFYEEEDEEHSSVKKAGGLDDDPDFMPEPVLDTGVSFKSVGGIREIKEELQRLVRFLHEPAKYHRLGAKLPKGVLLKGSPGTGKTLLAKALAHESKVPMISVSGTAFESMWQGIGASRMRKVISRAKELVEEQKVEGRENPSCIIYIDEIDVFAGRRVADDKSSHQTIMMELATAMEGFEPSDGITVIASTNRPEVLDPALMRPGRFDSQLEVPAPDVKGRKEILNILCRDRKIPLKVDADLGLMAKKTYGFAGAELSLLINEAAIIAADQGGRKVGKAEFEQAYNRVLKGPRSYLDMTIREEERTALHEAGHAIVGLRQEEKGSEKVRSVTILPHIGALGVTFFADDKDKQYETLEKFKSDLAIDYAGRMAEELAFGSDKISSGASCDIEMATETALKMVAHFGFNETLGLLNYGGLSEGYLGSAFTKAGGLDPRITKEMKIHTDAANEEARRILTEDYDALIRLSKALIERETLDREEIIKVTGIQPGRPKQPSLKQLAARGPIIKPAS